jgi:hypothetical protein
LGAEYGRSSDLQYHKGDESNMCVSSFRKMIPLLLSIIIASFCIAPAVFGQGTPQTQVFPKFQPPQPQPAAYNCEPVNPNTTPEARALLKKLCDLSGKGILTGHHNFPNNGSQHSEKILEITGKYPAVWGSDFGFLDGEDKDSIMHRDRGAIGSGTQNSCPGWHVNQSSAESAEQQSPGLRLLSSRNPGLEQP